MFSTFTSPLIITDPLHVTVSMSTTKSQFVNVTTAFELIVPALQMPFFSLPSMNAISALETAGALPVKIKEFLMISK
jgi:hypothetical protein